VFVEYTPLPSAKFPTQLEESYAALKWISTHADEFGADGSRIAIAGNSVGGNMTAALTLMAKDRKGPKVAYQVLLIPATDASVDTASYHEFATGRFLPRAFMKYGWDLYAPDEKTRNNPYMSPLRASSEELRGLPPALVITAENDPLRDEGSVCAEAHGRRRSGDDDPLQRDNPRLRAAQRPSRTPGNSVRASAIERCDPRRIEALNPTQGRPVTRG
jgi:acetyl esterase/lipase